MKKFSSAHASLKKSSPIRIWDVGGWFRGYNRMILGEEAEWTCHPVRLRFRNHNISLCVGTQVLRIFLTEMTVLILLLFDLDFFPFC